MEYKYKWYIPDAYLHSRGTGYFTSHEGCAFINETDRDAHVRFTFYFQDREPMTGYTIIKSSIWERSGKGRPVHRFPHCPE